MTQTYPLYMLIRLEARANDLDVHKTWHRAYHGTSPETVASIFRAGNLFAAGTHILMLNAFCFCLFLYFCISVLHGCS